MNDTDVRLNLLVAYPYLISTPDTLRSVEANQDKVRFLIDCGAFTAWKAGKPIELDDYCRFIEALPFRPWRYFALDVIGDPEGTRRNYETMLARGLNPVPIFTRGEAIDELDRYYETSDLVGIGGLVGTQGNRGFVRGIMERVGTRKVHWLGFTNPAFLKAYRPYMCDSSSWEGGARFGQARLYLGGGKLVAFNREVVQGGIPPHYASALRRLGFDPGAFQCESAWRGGESQSRRLGAASYVAFSLDAQRHIGTLVFMALASNYANALLAAYGRLAPLYQGPTP